VSTRRVLPSGKVVYKEYQPRNDKNRMAVWHPVKKYLSSGEASKFVLHVYGIEVSPRMLRVWVRDGIEDPHKPNQRIRLKASTMAMQGKKYYIKRSILVNWIEYLLVDNSEELKVE